MKAYSFGFLEDNYTRWANIRTCADFQSLVTSVPLRDRPRLRGKPYRKAFSVAVFQDAWFGKINPFWVKIFKCRGEEINFKEAAELFSPQLLIPLDRRPSQDKEVMGKRRPKDKKKKTLMQRRPPVFKPTPTSDYLRNGFATTFGYNGNGPFGPSTVYAHVVSTRNSTKTSVKTLNFKLIKKRDLPWNNFNSSVLTASEETGLIVVTDGADKQTISGYVRGALNTGNDITQAKATMGNPLTTTANVALVKALMRAKDAKVNLAQMYGEKKQAAGLLYSSINRLLQLAVALKKGNVKQARTLLNGYKGKDTAQAVPLWNSTGTHVIGRKYVHVRKGARKPLNPYETFANLWLEFQYGWRPLLSDIYGSAEYIANTYHKPKVLRVSATSKAEVLVKNYLGTTVSEKIEMKRTSYSHVVLEFLEPTEWTNVLSKTGLSNPALLAWELAPYSFVVDWILPLGDYLKTLDATVGLNFKRGSTMTRTVDHMQSSLVGKKGTAITGSQLSVVRTLKDRVIYYTVPTPSFPVLSPKLGVERSLSAISLLTQLFVRGKTTVKI